MIREQGDATLVVLVAKGRQDALAELYRRHSGPVLGLAKRLIRNVTLAEDVVQEVFVRLWNDPEKYDPSRGSLRSYLLTHAHGRSIDLVRAEAARRRREEVEGMVAQPAGPDVEEQAWRSEVSSRVRAALAELEDGEREAIELAYFGGHPYREVAKMLGQPEGTVKSRIRTGMRRMRGALVVAGIEPGGGVGT